MSMVSTMSLMPTGMPSISDSGSKMLQRAAERVGGFACAGLVQMNERANLGLQLGDGRKAAFEIIARRVAPRGKYGARPS